MSPRKELFVGTRLVDVASPLQAVSHRGRPLFSSRSWSHSYV